MKVIHPEHARSDEQRARIRQEALIGAQVTHPNVAPILDFAEDHDGRGESLLLIITPLLIGRSLRETVLDGPSLWRTVGRPADSM